MTTKNVLPKQKKRESEKSVAVLSKTAGQEVRAKLAATELVLEVWTRVEVLVLPEADEVLVKLAALGGQAVPR